MEKKFVSNKAFLINPQGKILFVRHTGKRADACYEPPGGRMNAGESLLEGLQRELREELGIEIDPRKARPFHTDHWRFEGGEQDAVVGIFYVIPIGEVSIQLSEEHTEYVWIDPRQETTVPMFESLRRALDAYRTSEGIVVANDRDLIGHQGFGLIQVITGNGKGKTTSATGLMVRAVGAGKKVGVVYFDKGGESHYFERDVLRKLGVDLVATGRDRIDPVTGRFDFSIQDIDRDEATRGLLEVERMFDAGCDLVVMDEINSTMDLGMVSVERVLELLEKKPTNTELVLTGRNVPDVFRDRAHLISEVGLRKHYFYSGVKAREGLDF
jgi:cob(I)alamin adenosyltransferase